MSVLTDILKRTVSDLKIAKARRPLSELQKMAKDAPPVRSLKKALRAARFSIIGEIKERSPSAGEMSSESVQKALAVYNQSRAISAVSILTDAPYFGGSLERLWQARRRLAKPILRKDFIIDEYQLWEARAFGADAVLLMASVHADSRQKLHDLYHAASGLGLQCLMEIGMSHIPAEEQAAMVPPEAPIWGINSRKFDSTRFQVNHQLGNVFGSGVRSIGPDYSVNPDRHSEMRQLIPAGKIAVAESGITDPSELQNLVDHDYDAALIGTAFLRPPGKIAQIVGEFAEAIKSLDRTASRAHA